MGSRWAEAFNGLPGKGLRLTIKEDARTHSIMAMVQAAEYNPEGGGTIYVMRGGTVESTLVKLAYWLVQADGELPVDDDESAGRVKDDWLFG